MLIGDFNTGLHYIDEIGATLSCADEMLKLIEMGWCDAFRKCYPKSIVHSWWSHKNDGSRNGFRLDHAFVTPVLREHIISCKYINKIDDYLLVDNYSRYPKTANNPISDHAGLIVQLNL